MKNFPFSKRLSAMSAITFVSVILSLVLGIHPTQAVEPSGLNHLSASFDKLPLSFVPNLGQFDPSVRMQANGLGGTLAFAPTSMVLSLPSEGQQQTKLQLQWNGANSRAEISGMARLPGVYHSYVGNAKAWRSNVPTYGSLQYHNLYPGIDLRYDGQDGLLKGTYTVAPSADPAQIRWRYQGAKAVAIDPATGDLRIELRNGNVLREHAPIAWQNKANRRIPVAVQFTIEKETVSFSIGRYDAQTPLVIDPTLEYSTFLGGNSTDSGNAIAIDKDGNVVVTGQTYSTNFPGAPGARGGSTDFFVSKLNAQGTALLYTTIIGGSDDEESADLAIDKGGNVWITGYTQSDDFPTNSIDTLYHGNDDTFVTKLDTTGQFLYGSYLGLSVHDQGYSIAVDNQGNAYIAGEVAATYGPEAFVKKVNGDISVLVYEAFFGSAKRGFDKGTSPRAIAVDGEGNTYITGRTNAIFSDTDDGGYQPFCKESDGLDCTYDDVFVIKLNAAGNGIPFYTYLGGNGNDIGTGIAVDGSGNILVTGYTFADNFPTKNAAQATKRGEENFTDAFVTKLNPQLDALLYSTYLGGTYWEEGHSLTVDPNGNAYVVGMTNSPDDFPVSSDAPQPKLGNGICLGGTERYCYDGFASKLSPTGTLLWSTFLGGSDDDVANDVAVDSNGNAYIVGSTESRNFPIIAGGFQTSKGLQKDAFLVKIGKGSNPTATPTVTPVTPTPTKQPTATATPPVQTPEAPLSERIFLPLVQR